MTLLKNFHLFRHLGRMWKLYVKTSGYRNLARQNKILLFAIKYYPDIISKNQNVSYYPRRLNTCSWKLHYLFTISKFWERSCSAEETEKVKQPEKYFVYWGWATSHALRFSLSQRATPTPFHNLLTQIEGTRYCLFKEFWFAKWKTFLHKRLPRVI